jgi:hypothetical protein
MARRPDERWRQFAERIANAFGLVLLLVVATYVLASLTAYKGWTAVLTTTLASTAAVVAFASAGARPRLVRVAAGLALAAIVLAVIAAAADSPHLLGASAFVQVALLLVATGFVLHAVVTESAVGFRTILGAISVYMILGLLFTFLYAAIDRVQDGAFFSGGASASGGNAIFFSFTTLTTTGFGDLVPAGQPGRMFAGLEMLIGQIFLVTLVAGLVSLWRPSTRARSGTGG